MPSQNFRVKNGLEVGTDVTISATGIISATGPVLVGTATTTGTATQRLQVTGGAYVSGNLGIGTTNPTAPLTVYGGVNISGPGGVNVYSTLYKNGTPIYFDSSGMGELQIKQNGGHLSFYNPIFGADFVGKGDWTFDTYDYGEIVRIKNNGKVGIGTTNPTSKLQVVGNVNISGVITASSFSGNATSATTATTANALNTGNNYQVNSFGVGTAASGTAGEIRATNNITAYYSSDINLKTNIEPIDEPLKKLLDITGVKFEWTDECIENRGGEDGYFVRKNDIGVIAQEIEKVLPEAVATREDGYKAVRYELLIPLLIESVKEQQKQIEELKNTINEKL